MCRKNKSQISVHFISNKTFIALKWQEIVSDCFMQCFTPSGISILNTRENWSLGEKQNFNMQFKPYWDIIPQGQPKLVYMHD